MLLVLVASMGLHTCHGTCTGGSTGLHTCQVQIGSFALVHLHDHDGVVKIPLRLPDLHCTRGIDQGGLTTVSPHGPVERPRDHALSRTIMRWVDSNSRGMCAFVLRLDLRLALQGWSVWMIFQAGKINLGLERAHGAQSGGSDFLTVVTNRLLAGEDIVEVNIWKCQGRAPVIQYRYSGAVRYEVMWVMTTMLFPAKLFSVPVDFAVVTNLCVVERLSQMHGAQLARIRGASYCMEAGGQMSKVWNVFAGRMAKLTRCPSAISWRPGNQLLAIT